MNASPNEGSNPPYQVKLDPEEARRLNESGASILLLDVPAGTSLGVDRQMFVVGPRFGGLKMVPPGPHFIYYAAASRHGPDVAPVIGFFLYLSPSQVIVRQWDAKEDCLIKCKDLDQEERYIMSVKHYEFDSRLGAYDLPNFHPWRHLSCHVTASVIERHEPVGGNICVIAEADVAESRAMSAAEMRLKEHLKRGKGRDLEKDKITPPSPPSYIPPSSSSSPSPSPPSSSYPPFSFPPAPPFSSSSSLSQIHSNFVSNKQSDSMMEEEAEEEEEEREREKEKGKGRENVNQNKENYDKEEKKLIYFGKCFYSDIKLIMKKEGLTPQQLTNLNLDKSEILENMIEKTYKGNENDMLGEFQFCFIAFLLGQSIESFLQWKKFIFLFCSCYYAPTHSRTKLFTKWLDSLYWQLRLSLDSKSDVISTHPNSHNVSPWIGLLDSDWIPQNNFMLPLFTDWFDSIFDVHSIDSDLLNQCRKLRTFLESHFGWKFHSHHQRIKENQNEGKEEDEEDEDEFAPVVVELDEYQMSQIA